MLVPCNGVPERTLGVSTCCGTGHTGMQHRGPARLHLGDDLRAITALDPRARAGVFLITFPSPDASLFPTWTWPVPVSVSAAQRSTLVTLPRVLLPYLVWQRSRPGTCDGH